LNGDFIQGQNWFAGYSAPNLGQRDFTNLQDFVNLSSSHIVATTVYGTSTFTN